MAGLLDWLTDGAVSSPVFGGGTPAQPGPGSTMPQYDPMGSATGGSMPLPTPAPAPTQPMPPVQPTGQDAPPLAMPQGTDPMTAGGPTPNGPGLPFANGTDPMTAGGATPGGPGLPPPAAVPMPQPRPAVQQPQPAAPAAAPGAIPPPPPEGVPVNNTAPAQSMLGRALGITPDQAGRQGQQIGSGLAAGLKSVGDNWNKPGLAALAGSAGAAMQGGQKKAEQQDKAAADYLKSAIDSKKAGDEAGYKQNYLKYLAAKLQADTDKAGKSAEAAANKNDSPTQLYLSAQRLVQPERNALNKQIAQMQKEGADPAAIATAQAQGEAKINASLNDHYATLGLHPQTAAQVAQQPGNSQQNPIDAAKVGITLENAAKKLQPGQWFKNPPDGKLLQYNPDKAKKDTSDKPKSAIPDKPTNPEPANPMNKSEVSAGATKTSAAADDDDED